MAEEQHGHIKLFSDNTYKYWIKPFIFYLKYTKAVDGVNLRNQLKDIKEL